MRRRFERKNHRYRLGILKIQGLYISYTDVCPNCIWCPKMSLMLENVDWCLAWNIVSCVMLDKVNWNGLENLFWNSEDFVSKYFVWWCLLINCSYKYAGVSVNGNIRGENIAEVLWTIRVYSRFCCECLFCDCVAINDRWYWCWFIIIIIIFKIGVWNGIQNKCIRGLYWKQHLDRE